MNPTIERALEELTSRIGPASALNEPMHRADAASALRKLHESGETLEPEVLAAWASLHGWTPKGVAQIRSLANDVMTGRRAPVSLAVHAAGPALDVSHIRR